MALSITLMEKSAVIAAIDAHAQVLLNSDYTIHQLAMQTLLHAVKLGSDDKPCGDVTLADRLVKSLVDRKGELRQEAMLLAKWYLEYSPIRWNGKKEVSQAKPDSKSFAPYNLEDANSNPFWTFKTKGQNKISFDEAEIIKLIAGIGKRLETKVDNGEVEGDVERMRRIAKAALDAAKAAQAV